MISPEEITETIGEKIEEFYESDDTIIDLTNPKTFIVASFISGLCGFCIGLGYQIIFTTLDCSSTLYTLSGATQVCFPNKWGEHKITIMIITIITGVLIGISPRLIKHLHNEGWLD